MNSSIKYKDHSDSFNASTEAVGSHLLMNDEDLHDFARGAAFLGTGGGGDPYIGRLMAKAAIEQHGFPNIVSPDDLSDDATVAFIAMLGAPTVLVEKAASGADIDLAVKRLSQRIGRPIDALMPAEIGGVNSTLPIVAAARLGIPLLNADGMGRAFPEIQMVVMNFEGISATPFVIVDEHLNSVIVETGDAKTAEDFVRTIAMHMGLSCIVSGYPMSGADVKRATIHNTMTEALSIGRAIRLGRNHGDPTLSLVQSLNDSITYGYGKMLFEGKIIDLRRETTGGFAVGHCFIEGAENANEKFELIFQNENLVGTQNGRRIAMVPDLITVVESETIEPIPTELLRYGQRVKVIGAAAPKLLRTKRALEFVHPKNFGFDFEYVPIETIEVNPEST